jgi:eukaryotic-like serine/threonine-protein kinase
METASDVIGRLSAALHGRYRIEREVGAGGMATVYLADDLKHGRRVAVKVLNAEVAAAVGAARFLAEIGTTAKLQHHHVLPLFDSGAVDDLLFYVTPYLEGGSLQDRLRLERQLPVDEAIRITIAAAQALDYAHRHGVVHRDIKPANILLHEGQPMVADFGIALALGATATDRLTATGMSLGTPLYMSPEQATGERIVGAPTDIYALGCVLYELLVGEPPYTGNTAQAILARIITGGPVSARVHRRSVPLHVDAAIQKALEQLPADRFASAGDFAAALSAPRSLDVATSMVDRPSRPWKRISIALAAIACTLALTNVWSLASTRRSEPRAVSRFDITPGDSQKLARAVGSVGAAISPDGTGIVYVGQSSGGATKLWRRQLSSLQATPLPGTERASAPVISPDGRSVAFNVNGDIRTMLLAGGALGHRRFERIISRVGDRRKHLLRARHPHLSRVGDGRRSSRRREVVKQRKASPPRRASQ